MSGDDIARILFLSILAASFAAVALRRYRGRRADMLKQAAIWAVIILSLTALYTYLDGAKAFRPSHPCITANTISVPRAPDGHYHITMAINGKNLEAIVDTGASDLVLSLDAARKAGIDTDALRFLGAAST
ncbi:MAG: retropepsin-like aspartic protease family protein, partial [Mangrovicoccus sp.]